MDEPMIDSRTQSEPNFEICEEQSTWCEYIWKIIYNSAIARGLIGTFSLLATLSIFLEQSPNQLARALSTFLAPGILLLDILERF